MQFVTSNDFQVLRIPILAGRGFAAADDVVTGTTPTAVISHELWQSRFAGDPGIIGRTITVDPLNSYDRAAKSAS